MKLARRIIDFYVFSNLHVSLATFFFVLITGRVYDIDVFWKALFIGSSTFFSYYFIRVIRYKSLSSKNWKTSWYKDNDKYITPLAILSLLTIIYSVFRIDFINLLILIPFTLITILYSVPFCLNTNKRGGGLRNIPFMKIILISLIWSFCISIFTIYDANREFNISDYIFWFERFLFVLVLTLPFDIRDLPYDDKRLRTIPQVLGVFKTKSLGMVLIMIILIFYLLDGFKNNTSDFVILIVLAVFLVLTKTKNKYFCSFWVESVPVMWFILSLCSL
ncbi:MAG: hypothetical protein HRT66_13955 [Flavobacteriaceae bacterium]|nr:hypothetical protein [Flavobacteriaceae bacterium]